MPTTNTFTEALTQPRRRIEAPVTRDAKFNKNKTLAKYETED